MTALELRRKIDKNFHGNLQTHNWMSLQARIYQEIYLQYVITSSSVRATHFF